MFSLAKRKILRQLLALLLILGINASGLMAETCLCGGSCGHSLQRDKSEGRVNPLFHRRCSESTCNSCNVEEGQTIKAAKIPSSREDFDSPDDPRIMSAVLRFSFTYPIVLSLPFVHTAVKVKSSPIYLTTLSLLL